MAPRPRPLKSLLRGFLYRASREEGPAGIAKFSELLILGNRPPHSYPLCFGDYGILFFHRGTADWRANRQAFHFLNSPEPASTCLYFHPTHSLLYVPYLTQKVLDVGSGKSELAIRSRSQNCRTLPAFLDPQISQLEFSVMYTFKFLCSEALWEDTPFLERLSLTRFRWCIFSFCLF